MCRMHMRRTLGIFLAFLVISAGAMAKTAEKSASHVRRDKAALFQWVQSPPGDRSSRKQPEQAWRRRNV
jgi:hypothetical protein